VGPDGLDFDSPSALTDLMTDFTTHQMISITMTPKALPGQLII
jgi:hypothetical protein